MKPSKPDSDSPLHGLLRYLPILQWLPQYQFSWLRADIIAGLTVWAVIVPEAMAYAGIAGVPPLVGLYTVPVPLIAYGRGADVFSSVEDLTGVTPAVLRALRARMDL